jgi:hypothetical protein
MAVASERSGKRYLDANPTIGGSERGIDVQSNKPLARKMRISELPRLPLARFVTAAHRGPLGDFRRTGCPNLR